MDEIDLTDPYAVNETMKEKNRAIAALTREVAGLREVLAYISMIADSIWVDCVTGAADASDPAPMKAESIMKAVKDALSVTTDTKETTQRHRPFPSSGLAAIEK